MSWKSSSLIPPAKIVKQSMMGFNAYITEDILGPYNHLPIILIIIFTTENIK